MKKWQHPLVPASFRALPPEQKKKTEHTEHIEPTELKPRKAPLATWGNPAFWRWVVLEYPQISGNHVSYHPKNMLKKKTYDLIGSWLFPTCWIHVNQYVGSDLFNAPKWAKIYSWYISRFCAELYSSILGDNVEKYPHISAKRNYLVWSHVLLSN